MLNRWVRFLALLLIVISGVEIYTPGGTTLQALANPDVPAPHDDEEDEDGDEERSERVETLPADWLRLSSTPRHLPRVLEHPTQRSWAVLKESSHRKPTLPLRPLPRSVLQRFQI
jgi:hypothetical protein